ncbi:50S ribosomal protein L17 [Candidatus Microgenomates bacterium]|nr:50S ribosomal protein L17 [Candidatus Microgenomates bacterium]
MKKRIFGRKFSRDTGARRALLRSLAYNLIKNGTIETTISRAKAVKPFVDKLVTFAKKKTLVSHRQLLSELGDNKQIVLKLEEEAKNRFVTLSSGFTSMVRVERRMGDDAPMVRMRWSKESSSIKNSEGKEKKSKSKSKKI